MPLQKSFSELLRRTELTCKARYHAARRLDIHGWFSQWTLAFLAIGQIVISLIPALNIATNFPQSYINFMGIFFGVLVLAYSLLLGMGNHAARSIKLHQCGLELGELARKLYPLSFSNNASQEEYENAAHTYYSILEKCENHSRADYLVSRLDYYEPSQNISSNPLIWLKRQKDRVEMYLLHALQFSHYLFSITLISIWIFYLIKR